jgi:menaquinone-specific isochorismate synthase
VKAILNQRGDVPDLLKRHPRIWWSSPEVVLAGFGEVAIFDPGIGAERYHRAKSAEAPIAFFGFTFDGNAQGSVVAIPELTVEVREGNTFIHGDSQKLPSLTEESSTEDRPRFAGSSLPDHLWLEAVGSILELIENGEVEKVVLARDHALWSKARFDPYRVLGRLIERFPDCYIFLLEGLVGASPELLIRKTGRLIESVTLAGTAARDASPDNDAMLGQELLTNPKTAAEHRLAAIAVGNILGTVASDLRQSETPEILKLANVQHLATSFSGHLKHDDLHVLELVARLHPTPAVGGLPVDVALSTIKSLEGMDRNRYAGPVGYFRANGDGEVAIALRCAELSGARARLFAGNGIVAGSIPEDELEETRLKLAAMLSALS